MSWDIVKRLNREYFKVSRKKNNIFFSRVSRISESTFGLIAFAYVIPRKSVRLFGGTPGNELRRNKEAKRYFKIFTPGQSTKISDISKRFRVNSVWRELNFFKKIFFFKRHRTALVSCRVEQLEDWHQRSYKIKLLQFYRIDICNVLRQRRYRFHYQNFLDYYYTVLTKKKNAVNQFHSWQTFFFVHPLRMFKCLNFIFLKFFLVMRQFYFFSGYLFV